MNMAPVFYGSTQVLWRNRGQWSKSHLEPHNVVDKSSFSLQFPNPNNSSWTLLCRLYINWETISNLALFLSIYLYSYNECVMDGSDTSDIWNEWICPICHCHPLRILCIKCDIETSNNFNTDTEKFRRIISGAKARWQTNISSLPQVVLSNSDSSRHRLS